MGMSDSALLEAAHDEVTEIREANALTPDQPTKYEPLAFTRQGFAD